MKSSLLLSSKLTPAVQAAAIAGAALLTPAPGWCADKAPTAAESPQLAASPTVDQPLAPLSNDTPDAQPSPQHAWVPGHWRWHDGAFVWEAGRWEIPPTPDVTWVPPQWEPQGRGYTLKDGHWEVTANPSPPLAVPEISTTEPPPAPQREIIPERPSGAHVWLPGYWNWQDGRYAWVTGHWEVPPRSQAVWVAPRWEQRGARYVFVSGYWRDAVAPTAPAPTPTPATATAATGATVIVTAPPPPRQEVVYIRPSPHHVWVNGYWVWRGNRYVWVAGHWELPPSGYRHWIAPRWERRGGTYVFIEGHWGR